jgi:hypothetical protein
VTIGPYVRWRQTLERLRTVRYRKPYCARHSSVSWALMMGRSALWVARQHGHSIATMLRFYAVRTLLGPRSRHRRDPECDGERTLRTTALDCPWRAAHSVSLHREAV